MSRSLYPLFLAVCIFPLPLVLLGAGPSSGSSKVIDYPLHEKTLDNGLQVVVVPFDSPGLVAHWVIVRAGSRNEIEPGHSGFAHFFEHMMFRGTKRFSEDEYNEVLKGMGADHNAFTSDDVTAYHVLAGADSLPRIMDLESDRFMNLKYSKEVFQKEAKAVLGEYNKNFSFPGNTIQEKLYEAAFKVHTYQHTTMGFLRDIKDMPNQYDYSIKFYDRYYRPEHCILLVVGDVEPAEVLAMAEKYYGPWERGSYQAQIPVEPPQTEEKRVDIPWENPTLPYLTIGYHGPAFNPKEKGMPAMDIISQIAFSETSPLFQKLVIEEQWVDFIAGFAVDHRDPNLFTIIARIKDEGKIDAVREAIDQTLEDLKNNPVDAQRLADIKNHLKYSFQMQLDTAEAVAQTLAHMLQLTGDPLGHNDLYQTYDSLTPQDIQGVAETYFQKNNRTVVVLTHQKGVKR